MRVATPAYPRGRDQDEDWGLERDGYKYLFLPSLKVVFLGKYLTLRIHSDFILTLFEPY